LKFMFFSEKIPGKSPGNPPEIPPKFVAVRHVFSPIFFRVRAKIQPISGKF
jgi:hypothetical protein